MIVNSGLSGWRIFARKTIKFISAGKFKKFPNFRKLSTPTTVSTQVHNQKTWKLPLPGPETSKTHGLGNLQTFGLSAEFAKAVKLFGTVMRGNASIGTLTVLNIATMPIRPQWKTPRNPCRNRPDRRAGFICGDVSELGHIPGPARELGIHRKTGVDFCCGRQILTSRKPPKQKRICKLNLSKIHFLPVINCTNLSKITI
jgi:hypothetical protein